MNISLELFILFLCVYRKCFAWNFSSKLSESIRMLATNSVPIPYDRKYFVKVKADFPGRETRYCGGAVVDPYWVVTAAHCLAHESGYFTNERNILVMRRNFADWTSPDYRLIKIWTIHPYPSFEQLHEWFVSYDIALLQLEEPLPYDCVIRLCQYPMIHGSLLHLITMGYMSPYDEERNPTTLHEVAFYESKFRFHNIWNTEFCPDFTICTNPVVPGTWLCKGDSGSPLVKRYCSSSRWNHLEECLAGIGSHFVREQTSNYWQSRHERLQNTGNYFTSVPYFYTWIVDTILNNSFV